MMIKSALRDIAAKAIHLFPKGFVYFGHGVANKIKDSFIESLHMPKPAFIALLEFWKKSGVDFYSLQDVYDLRRKNFKSKKPWIHFTFDDGYQNNLSTLLPIMENYEIPFTVFATTGLINECERMPSYKIKVAILNGLGEFKVGHNKFSLKSTTNSDERMVIANGLIQQYKTLPFDEVRSLITSIEKILDDEQWTEMNRQFCNDQLLSVNELKKLAQHELVSIGTHGVQHMILHEKQDEEQVNREIIEPIVWLKNELGVEAKAFAYPNGQRYDYTSYSVGRTKASTLELVFTTQQALIRPSIDAYCLPRMFMEASVNSILKLWLVRNH